MSPNAGGGRGVARSQPMSTVVHMEPKKNYGDLNPWLTYTVTRPYAGFRRPDRMAPDQTVRGGENDCFIWSGNFLAQVPKVSSILGNPGIFRRFTWSSVRGAPFLCWYFTLLDAGRHFRNVPESYPVKMKDAPGRIELRPSWLQLHTSTSTPQLPYMKPHMKPYKI